MTALLETRDLAVRFGAAAALRGASLSVAAGETVGLLGPNAAGKTTLLRCAAGLLRPDSGSVRLGGAEIGALTATDRARRLAYLEQNAACHWPIAARRLVMLGRLPHMGPWRRPGAADEQAVDRAMARCGVSHLAARPATALSGGEQARVMLARALAGEPALLLADEPVSHLDPAQQIAVMELLRAHAATGGAALAVLHDLTLASRFCDRVVLMADGRIAADGPPGTVLTPDRLAAVFGITASFVEQDGGVMVIPRGRIGGDGPEGAP